MPEAALLPEESVPLLTAWVSRLGADLGVRTLVIKGPLMAAQGLRTERASNDVDVWVDPARFSEFTATLERFGWRRVFTDARHTILPQHSIDAASPALGVRAGRARPDPGLLHRPGRGVRGVLVAPIRR